MSCSHLLCELQPYCRIDHLKLEKELEELQDPDKDISEQARKEAIEKKTAEYEKAKEKVKYALRFTDVSILC